MAGIHHFLTGKQGQFRQSSDSEEALLTWNSAKEHLGGTATDGRFEKGLPKSYLYPAEQRRSPVESLRRVRIWSQQAHGGSLTRCSSGK